MTDISRAVALVKITTFGLILPFALIYSCPIIFIRRFHHRFNFLTLNISVATICAALYWMIYFLMWEYEIENLFTINTCAFLFYAQQFACCLPGYAFVSLTLNRFCAIIYPGKRFFKTKSFVVICIVSHWILVLILSLPFVVFIQPVGAKKLVLKSFQRKENLFSTAVFPNGCLYIC